MKKLFFLIIIICCVHFSVLTAQYIDMKFIDVLDKHKLTNSFTTCIAQDSLGFIWIGTTGGLNRFDGYNVHQYKHVSGDSTSIPHNNIIDIFIDPKQRLWILTKVGACRYNPIHDNFTIIADENHSAGLPGLGFQKVKSGMDDRVVVAVNNELFTFSEENKLFESLVKIDHGVISNFLFDADSSIWIGANNGGVCHFSKNKNLLQHFGADIGKYTLSNADVLDIARRDNEIWVATNGGGINVINTTSLQTTYLPVPGEYAQYATDVFIDNNNRAWTIDFTGLKLYDDKTGNFHGYYPYNEDEFSIKPVIIDIFQDRQNNYWTLHAPNGVGLRIPPRGFHYFNTKSYWKTSDNNISAVCEDNYGNLWLGNPNNGIDIFYWSQNTVKTYHHHENNPFSLGEGSVNVIKPDSKGVMWVGTYLGGLQYFEPESERFISYTHIPENKNSVACNDIRDIEEDKDGNLWLVAHGKGVDVFNRKNGTFIHYNNTNSGLSNDWAFDILIDHNENVWVATAWGLSLLKKEKQNFQVYLTDNDDPNSLTNNEVICLHQDKLNRLWIGTSGGLNLYVPEKDEFKRINFNNSSIYIAGILSDDKNHIWASTLSGIKKYNPDMDSWMEFTKKDGLSSDEYHARSVFNNGKNTLFFGSIGGVNLVSPDNMYINTEPPKVVLTDFQLFYQSVSEYSQESVLTKNIVCADHIELKYHQNIITFKFAAINFYQTERNQYAYMMDGFDDDWIYCGTRREAIYTNLDPGKYTFRVKAANNDGVWNEQGTSIAITVVPPWWRTWLFRLFVLLFIILSVSAINYIRIIQLQKQKETLARLVNEKTVELYGKNEILVKQTDDLNNVNTLLEERQQHIEEQSEELKSQAENQEKLIRDLRKLNLTKDKMFSIISHDLRSPFNSIMGFSDLLAETFDELQDDQKKAMATTIQHSTQKVYNLLENLLKWARSQTGNITYAPGFYKLSDVFKDIEQLLDSSLKQKDITMENDVDMEQQVHVDIDMIYTVIRNILSNALKFTKEGGKLRIEGKKGESHYEIKITDTGIGIPEKIMGQLFEIEDTKVRQGTAGDKGSGLGLILCKEFVERNKGEIRVESEEGKGTTFTFTMPLSK